jgi:hypothetical protein
MRSLSPAYRSQTLTGNAVKKPITMPVSIKNQDSAVCVDGDGRPP